MGHHQGWYPYDQKRIPGYDRSGTVLILHIFAKRESDKGFFFLYMRTTREIYTSFYEKKGSVTMLYAAIIMTIAYMGLEAMDKLDKKEEMKKAEEEGYEVYFSH